MRKNVEVVRRERLSITSRHRTTFREESPSPREVPLKTRPRDADSQDSALWLSFCPDPTQIHPEGLWMSFLGPKVPPHRARRNPTSSRPSLLLGSEGLGLAWWILLLALGMSGCGPGDDLAFTSRPGEVQGVILNGMDPSEPEEGVTVKMLGVSSRSGFTRPDGTYDIDDIEAGLYDLVATKGSRSVRLRFVEVVEDQILDIPDLSLSDPGSIAGTALLTGAGAANPVAPDSSQITVQLVGTNLSTQTAGDGSYRFDNVEVGEYAVKFSRSGFHSRTFLYATVPTAGTTTVPNVTLLRTTPPRFGAIQGMVTVEGANQSDSSGVTVRILGTTRTLVTTAGGGFVFTNLPIGAYDLGFEHPDLLSQTVDDVQVVSGVPITDLTTVALTNHELLSDRAISGLSLSPSGNQIAFLTQNNNASEIGLLSPTPRGFDTVITSGAEAAQGRGIEWTRNEQEIFYTRFRGNRNGAFDIALVSNVGGAPRSITPTGTDYFLGTFSPDGVELAYYLTESLQAIRLSKDSIGRTVLATPTNRVLAAGLGQLTELNGAEWANTGRLVFDRERADASDEVFTLLASGGFPAVGLNPRRQDLPGDPGLPLVGRFQSPSFSPNFSRVAFSLDPGSTSPEGIYVSDIDGENARRISTEPGQYLDWSPDGKWIYYARVSDSKPARLLVPRELR